MSRPTYVGRLHGNVSHCAHGISYKELCGFCWEPEKMPDETIARTKEPLACPECGSTNLGGPPILGGADKVCNECGAQFDVFAHGPDCIIPGNHRTKDQCAHGWPTGSEGCPACSNERLIAGYEPRTSKQEVDTNVDCPQCARLRAALTVIAQRQHQFPAIVAQAALDGRGAWRERVPDETTKSPWCPSLNPDMGMGRCEKPAGHGGFHQAAYIQWFEVR